MWQQTKFITMCIKNMAETFSEFAEVCVSKSERQSASSFLMLYICAFNFKDESWAIVT
jgi:hypothetical protein